MAGQADGSIIVDTELNSDGFKAGSAELLAAIKSLSSEAKALGQTLKETFGGSDKNVGAADSKAQALEETIASLQAQVKSLQATVTELQKRLDSLNSGQATETPVDGIAATAQGANEQITALKAKIKELEGVIAGMQEQLQAAAAVPTDINFDTDMAESKIAALENKVSELESTIAQLQSGEGTAAPDVNMGGATQKATELQRQIDAVNSSTERLVPTFQRALNGSKSAMTSFEAKAGTLEREIAVLQERLAAVGKAKFPTSDYTRLSAEVEKAGQKLETLLNKQEKMKNMGVKDTSAQWESLKYDLELAAQKYDALRAAKLRMESSGTAFQMGSDTTQYAQMEASLAAANQRLSEMQSGLSSSEGLMRRLASAAKSLFSWIGNVVKTISGKMLSGLKTAASHMAKMLTHSNSMKNQFGGLVSGAKKFALSLLGARGVYALLRKAVSAYMSENQTLSNTLSSCWTSIGNLLGPIITRLINLVATAIAYVTSFLKLFGIFSSSATSAIGSAGGAASSAVKDLKRQLASFDELNVLTDNSSDGGGGGGSGAGDIAASLPDVTLPDWAKLMVEQLKSGQWGDAASALTEQLNGMIASVDWAGIGDKIGYYLNGVLTFLATAILNFDWFALGSELATGVNHIIENVDWHNLGTVLGAKFRIMVEGLGGFFATLDWAGLGKALSDAFMGLWNSIKWQQAAKTLSDGIIGALNSLRTAIKNVDWQKLGNDIAAFVANIDWGSVADALFNALGVAFGALGGFLWGLLQDAFSSISSYFSGYIEEARANGGNWVDGLLQGILDGLCNIGLWIYEHVFQPIIQGFKDAFGIASPSTVMAEQGNFIVEGLLQGITEIWHTITEFFSAALEGIESLFSNTWESIKITASTLWNEVKTALTNIWSGIKNTASSIWAGMKTTVLNIVNGIKAGITNAFTSVKTWLVSCMNSIKAKVTSVWNGIWGNIKGVINSIIGGVEGMANGVINGINFMIKALNKISFEIPDWIPGIGGEKFGFNIATLNTISIPRLGEGGLVRSGQLFEARESGPELVGSYGGKSAVMNNDQIVDSVSRGVASAVQEEMKGFDSDMADISEMVDKGFSGLLDKLKVIAQNVTYIAPAVAKGVVPYRIATTGAISGDNLGSTIEASNDELASVVTQVVMNATNAIVTAIQNYSGTTVIPDKSSLAESVIKEINRRTRMTGQSPLVTG